MPKASQRLHRGFWRCSHGGGRGPRIGAMTPGEREKMDELCRRLAAEQNPEVFDRLVKELNELLEEKHTRIHPEHKIP